MKIKDNHKRFCEEYIKDLNGAKAMRRAGFSVHSAGVQAVRVLKRPEVIYHISKLMLKRSKRVNITTDNVLKQYGNLAFSDISNYYHIEYTLRFNIAKDPKIFRKRKLLQKYIGYTITEEVFNSLSLSHKMFYEPYKVLKPFDLLTKEQRASIVSITYDRNNNAILKLANKENALDALAKHLGMFKEGNTKKVNKTNKIKKVIIKRRGDKV